MKPFGNLFKKKPETNNGVPSPEETTEWDNIGAEVPFNPAEEAKKQNTVRQQNKVIATLTSGDLNVMNSRTVDISHATRQDFLDEVASGNINNEHWDYIVSNIADIGNKRSEYVESINLLVNEAFSPRVSGDEFDKSNGEKLTLDTKELEKLGLAPKEIIDFDNKRISISQMYKVHGHLACAAYVTSDEGTKICSYYRSNSSGSWRYLPEYTNEERWFGKGYNEESLTLPFEMQKKLTELSSGPTLELKNEDADFAFYGTAKKYNTLNDWLESKKEKTLRGIHYKESSTYPSYSLSPEVSTGPRPAPETVGVELLNSPFGPNFQEEIDNYNMRSDLYGDVAVKAYLSGNGKLRYTVCEVNHNGERQVWISGVESTNKTTAVGTPKQWVSAGVLATPLYEYGRQTGGYGDKTDTRGSYESMWKGYISRIPLIQKYIQETTPEERRVA